MGDPQTPLSPRLVAYARLFGGKSARDAAQPWSEFASRMRFQVGASAHERRVPFAFATDVSRVAARAFSDLTELFRWRADPMVPSDVNHIEKRERSFGLRAFREGSIERRAARALVGNDALLDAGLAEMWILRGGAGGALLAMMRAVYRKSLEEELKTAAPGGSPEPTTWATHLATILLLSERKEQLKSITVKGVGYEALERAVGVAFSAICWTALDDAISELRGRGLEPPASGWTPIAASSLALISIRQSALRTSPNPWGMPRELADAVDGLVPDPFVSEPLEGKVARVARSIRASREARELALEVGAINELRVSLLGYLREFDVGREPRHEAMLAAVLPHATLSAAFRDGRSFANGVDAAIQLAASAEGARRDRIDALADHFDQIARRRTIASEDATLAILAQGWLTWRFDRWAAETVETGRGHLADRSKEFGVAELKTNWEAGKIYRFASDDAALLHVRQTRSDGHLFLDLKGFTRLVATAKELSTAEFLKHEFYAPILEKALAYREAGRRIELNNLLGDAVSFSGDVVSLVYLAEDVRDLFAKYEEKVRKAGAPPQKIEAGLFIAHGAAAEVITIDSHGWGDAGVTEWVGKATRVKVAISEKINESARGTARNGNVWARMRTMLEQRRAHEADVELPWSVYVDRVLQLNLPPPEMALCEMALGTRDATIAEQAADRVAALLRASLGATDLAKRAEVIGRMTDIFNVGRALSKEALDAFVMETAALRTSVEKELPIAELPEALRRFVFPEETLKLVVSYDAGKARSRPIVFRYAGELSFRGFEGLRTTAIYEIVDQGSAVYQALERAFLRGWAPKAVAAG